jgi:hypothetical protein
MSHDGRARVWGATLAVLAGLTTFAVSIAAWAAGGPPATRLINVADTRGLEPGLTLWVANIYNESFVGYGALVVVVMAIMGGALGFGFDVLVSRLGVNLSKLEHLE